MPASRVLSWDYLASPPKTIQTDLEGTGYPDLPFMPTTPFGGESDPSRKIPLYAERIMLGSIDVMYGGPKKTPVCSMLKRKLLPKKHLHGKQTFFQHWIRPACLQVRVSTDKCPAGETALSPRNERIQVVSLMEPEK